MDKSFTLNGRIVSHRAQIILHYLKNNFIIDITFLFLVIFLVATNYAQENYTFLIIRIGFLFKFKPYLNLMSDIIFRFELMEELHDVIRIFDLMCSFFFFINFYSSIYFVSIYYNIKYLSRESIIV